MGRLRLSACPILILVATVVGPADDAPDLRRLIVMDDQLVAPLLADRLAWAGDGRLVVGGWECWPEQAAIVTHGCGLDAPWLPDPATPRFALDAGTGTVTYWRRAGEGGVVPGQFRLSDGRLLIPDPEFTSEAPGEIAPLADGAVVASRAAGDGELEVRRLKVGEGSTVLARLPHAVCDGLTVLDDDHVIASCPGDPVRHYRIDVRTGLWAEAEAPETQPTSAGGLTAPLDFDRGRREIARLVADERVVLADDADAACPLPGREAALFANPAGLWVIDAAGEVRRRLWGATPPGDDMTPVRVSCSPDGARVAHCYREGDGGRVRVAALGAEHVTVRLRFEEGSSVAPGSKIWVAERFQFDDAGLVTEPVWGTLKALLVAKEVVRAEAGAICTARSEGIEGGVVERLTGSNDAPPGASEGPSLKVGMHGEEPVELVVRFDAEPLEGLRAWAQGDRHVGALLSVTVERRRVPERNE